MTYSIKHADGRTIKIYEYDIDTSTSLTLIGAKNLNYGQQFWENLVHLMENFSSPYSPSNPTSGQLWYDNVNKLLKFYSDGKWLSVRPPPPDTSNFVADGGNMLGALVLPTQSSNTPNDAAATKQFITDISYKFKVENVNYVAYDNNYIIYNCIINTLTETVTLPFEMADTNYSILLTLSSTKDSLGARHTNSYNKTTTGFKVIVDQAYDTVDCIVMGFAK